MLDHLRVVLVSPRNPLNVGAAARAMSNFGCFDLRLVQAYRVAVDEARSAVKAGAVLERAREFSSVAEAVADCSLVVGTTAIGNRELQHTMRRLETGGRLIRKHMAAAATPAAILFGSEKFGLSNDDLTHCDWLMRIPTREAHGSMNLGQAVAVTLYELIRSPRAVVAETRAKKAATAEQLERLTMLLLDALRSSGYVNEKTAASTERKARRMVKRLDMPATDTEVWQGMFRQILWKLTQSGLPVK
ncbi:MAG TPA: TrmJ/YjtD family RNA methyltransferase [Bryobacteraceae bacterium]|jgi:tRNA/rRNA methyltransferase